MRGGWSLTALAASGAVALEGALTHSDGPGGLPAAGGEPWTPWSGTPPPWLKEMPPAAASASMMPPPHNQTSSAAGIEGTGAAMPKASSAAIPPAFQHYSKPSAMETSAPEPSTSHWSTTTSLAGSTSSVSSVAAFSYSPLSSESSSISTSSESHMSHSAPHWSASMLPILSSSLAPTEAHVTKKSASTSTVVVYAQKTEVVYKTIGMTVTACHESATACPAASTYVTLSTIPIGPGALPSASAAPSMHMPIPWPKPKPSSQGDCQLATSPLTNQQQVGNSISGTLCEKTFPKWLDGEDGQKYENAPWGDATTTNADPTVAGDIPNTNVTRYYEFDISRSRMSVDGVLRDMITINNQFPGPLIEANWGDWIEVKVTNNIQSPVEGTSLHWHGELQKSTPWEDGVPALGQCPIAPGSSYTYRYQAELYGTSWYHAHYSAQYTGGIVGAMQVYGPSQLPYDIDVGPVALSDWYHIPYFSIVADAVGTDLSKIPPTSDNLLINGRASFDCSKPSYSNSTEWLGSNIESDIKWTCVENATLSKFRFQSGKTHRLRLINDGADGIHKFSIDGHKMTVIAEDYVPVVPFEADVVTLGVGQRSDILVTALDDSTAAYWMRTRAPGGEACGGSDAPETLAAIFYEDADTTVMPTTSSDVNNTDCRNDDLAAHVPEYKITPSANPYQQDLEIALVLNSTGNYEWQINGQTFRANFNVPLLFEAAEGNVSYPYDPQWNVYNFDRNHSVVLNVTNGTPFSHPFHLHGHNFYVLNSGQGVWDGAVINPENPMRRDIQLIESKGYSVFQFEADNPGVWPFHCHVAWHLSGGLAMNIMSRPEDIPTIPAGAKAQTCAAWDAYSNSNVVDQIDAGS